MVAERNPQVRKTVVTFRELSADERVRDMYERRERARMDFESQKKWAMKQRAFEIAKKLLKRGRPIDEITEDTGLTREEVESLRHEL
jgi:predicted transposase YdaD